MTDLRWELADGPKAQATLFDEPVFEREPGRGEFSGIEFLHVRAHRIINEVRNAPFGFRWTINAYRGCTHACSYCLGGETPILMADGRSKPLADIRPGDSVYGTVRRGRRRHLAPTTVLDHWSTVKPAYRVRLEDGTELIASGDHRFLTDRGWKRVAAEAGSTRRAPLLPENALVGLGQLPTPPDEGPEYERGYLCGVIRAGSPPDSQPDTRRFRLELTDREALERARRYLLAFDVTTTESLQPATAEQPERWVLNAQTRKKVAAISALVAWPTDASVDWCKGFLAGAFDTAGQQRQGFVRFIPGDAGVLGQIRSCLGRLGFPHVTEPAGPIDRARGTQHVRLLGELPAHLRLLLTIDPAVSRKRSIEGAAIGSEARLRVVAIEPLGVDLPLFDITTGTGDFVADGVVSHNCFARPSHTYLGLDADRDFERRIVVKVNAVSLLRRELDARRWRGELIAMGTNTDPYQRCEGKYRLTRGLVEALVEHGNPFSILTKSTLLLRDLPLLVEAARQNLVRVNFSIGTLDEAVWRTTEPGTPHPARRVRAVESLNAAGVPCGVLVAPVLPEISDHPEQLEAVVRACLDAGAQSISTVALHLRPGVKEVFMARLEESHPHLVDSYRRRYRGRSYAAPADRDAIADLVNDLLRRHGPRATTPADATASATVDAPRRRTTPPTPGVDEPQSTQLQLL